MKTVVSTSNASSPANAATTAPPVTIVPKTEPVLLSSDSSNTLQFNAPNSVSAVGLNSKRPVSLDLNKSLQAKKPRISGPAHLSLEHLDGQNMKILNTPDLEKMLLANNLMQTPQPGLVYPAKVGLVTSEQEAFGKGFEEALNSLHNSKNSQVTLNNSAGSNSSITPPGNINNTSSTGMSGGSFTYTNLESSFPITVKDEPHNNSGSPPVSPIDMETQEKIKLERKRQRNRVAASKCRKRKLERISKLEDKVKILRDENLDLGAIVKSLKDHVAQLKQKVMQHLDSGCNIATPYNGPTQLQGK